MSLVRRTCGVACALELAFAAPAAADEAEVDKAECTRAHFDAQEHRRAGRLRAAHDDLVICTKPDCPAAVQAECAPWLSEVSAAIPTLVVKVTDHKGRDLVDVAVIVDGERVADRLDGSALEVDPGEHTIVVVSRGVSVTQRLLVREGERRRRVVVSFPPPKTSPPPAPKRARAEPAPIAPWVIMSVGVATVGAGSIAALLAALQRESAQEEPIQQRASEAFRDAERVATAANVLFGVGGALAAAGFVWGIVEVHAQSPKHEGALRVSVGASNVALALIF